MSVLPFMIDIMARREKIVWPYGPITTTYATAELIPENTARGIGVMLLLDGAESSYLEMNEPQYLVFEYMQYMQCAIQQVMSASQYRDFLHLGAAGCALPRALHAQYPKTKHRAIEHDALLAEYVRDWFELPRSPALRIRVSDARVALESQRTATLDVITRDVFAHRKVPYHTRTVGFFEHAARTLRPGGMFLANTGSQPGQQELRREVASILRVFSHVYSIAEPPVMKGRRPGNVVLIGCHQPMLDPLELGRQLRRLPIAPVLWNTARIQEWVSSAIPFYDESA